MPHCHDNQPTTRPLSSAPLWNLLAGAMVAAGLTFGAAAQSAKAGTYDDPLTSAGKPAKAPLYTAPRGLFSAQLPKDWVVDPMRSDPNTVAFHMQTEYGQGKLTVHRKRVPPTAHPKQLLLKSVEQRLSKLPGFRDRGRRAVKVAGTQGAAVVGTYYFQGNIQYPRALEEIVIVTGRDAFYFTFDCFQPSADSHSTGLNLFYQTFVPRPATGSKKPFEPIKGKRSGDFEF